MENISVERISEDFNALGTKLYEAATSRVDISVNEYDTFLAIVREFNIKVVFMRVERLEEGEIEEEIVTDEDLETRELRSLKEKITQEIVAFNNKLKNLLNNIGEEQNIKLFFQHDSVFYSFNYINFDLYPDLKEDFLELMLEQYKDEINEEFEQARSSRAEHLENILEKLKDYLVNSDTFKKCTNAPARKGYLYEVIKLEQFKTDFEDMPNRLMLPVVDAAWQQVRLNKVSES